MLKRQLFEMTKLKFFFFLKLLTGTNDFSNRDEDTNYDWILDETPRGKKRRHDTRHDGTQPNGTQHNITKM
jgi:hypothetical protein